MLLNGARAVTESEETETGIVGAAEPSGGFRAWRRRRPFIGGVLVAVGGVEMFFSGQLDIGRLHVQLGIEGLQATVIPVMLLVLGVLAITMPAHHIFYGIIALVVSIYSLIGVNLGGFLIGMLLSTVGGILVVAWMGPKVAAVAPPEPEGEAGTGEVTSA